MGIDYDLLIVRYSEIFLKKTFVKRSFRDTLISNIVEKLNRKNIDFEKIRVENNTICIYGNLKKEDAIYIANTFGVNFVSFALKCKSNVASIKERFSKVKDNLLANPPNSFCIRAKKDKQLKISHKTIEIELASFFDGIKVNLKNPELKIYVNANVYDTFIYWERIDGPGGLPYGCQGKVVALVSNGIDSPVSAWLMSKRGCEIIMLHLGNDEPDKINEVLMSYTGTNIKLINIPNYSKFLKNLREKNVGKYICILCKIAMYKIANIVAKKYSAKAIVTGESLGQVASQTLDNLQVLDKSSQLPVLRPLIGLNKDEIINLAVKIGTFDYEVNKRCEFVPDKPATRVSFDIYNELLEKVNINEEIENLLEEVSI